MGKTSKEAIAMDSIFDIIAEGQTASTHKINGTTVRKELVSINSKLFPIGICC